MPPSRGNSVKLIPLLAPIRACDRRASFQVSSLVPHVMQVVRAAEKEEKMFMKLLLTKLLMA